MTKISKAFAKAGYASFPHQERFTRAALKKLIKGAFWSGWESREKEKDIYLSKQIDMAVRRERDCCARLCDDMRLYCGVDCADAIRKRQ